MGKERKTKEECQKQKDVKERKKTNKDFLKEK